MPESTALTLEKKGAGVYVHRGEVIRLGEAEICFLKLDADQQALGRSRVCTHQNSSDTLHEMIITLAGGSYVQPHKHLCKNESFHIIEGAVDVVVFDDAGQITDVVELGVYGSGRSFYYRLNAPLYHTLLIHGTHVVVHETTNGPFIREDAVFANWAPDGNVQEETLAYLENVRLAAARFLEKKRINT